MRKVMYCLTSAIAVVMLIGFSIVVVEAGRHELPAIDPADFNSPQDSLPWEDLLQQQEEPGGLLLE